MKLMGDFYQKKVTYNVRQKSMKFSMQIQSVADNWWLCYGKLSKIWSDVLRAL